MKSLIEKAEQEVKKYISYLIRCDDKNKPLEIKADAWFRLWEFEKLSEYIQLCENHNLKYDLVIQEFDIKDNSVSYEINIINNNCLN